MSARKSAACAAAVALTVAALAGCGAGQRGAAAPTHAPSTTVTADQIAPQPSAQSAERDGLIHPGLTRIVTRGAPREDGGTPETTYCSAGSAWTGSDGRVRLVVVDHCLESGGDDRVSANGVSVGKADRSKDLTTPLAVIVLDSSAKLGPATLGGRPVVGWMPKAEVKKLSVGTPVCVARFCGAIGDLRDSEFEVVSSGGVMALDETDSGGPVWTVDRDGNAVLVGALNRSYLQGGGRAVYLDDAVTAYELTPMTGK